MPQPTAAQRRAIAKINKLGGTVTVDESVPSKPVIGVSMDGCNITDVRLESRDPKGCGRWIPADPLGRRYDKF